MECVTQRWARGPILPTLMNAGKGPTRKLGQSDRRQRSGLPPLARPAREKLPPNLVRRKTVREVPSMRRSHDPPRSAAGALTVPPPGDASQPLPFPVCPAFTSTVGIGAASCSGVRFPNSSASTSMLLTTKEVVNRSPTHQPAPPQANCSTRREWCARPKRSPPHRMTEGATERFRLLPA